MLLNQSNVDMIRYDIHTFHAAHDLQRGSLRQLHDFGGRRQNDLGTAHVLVARGLTKTSGSFREGLGSTLNNHDTCMHCCQCRETEMMDEQSQDKQDHKARKQL